MDEGIYFDFYQRTFLAGQVDLYALTPNHPEDINFALNSLCMKYKAIIQIKFLMNYLVLER